MSSNLNVMLSNIPDPTTREILKKAFASIVADMVANKAVFDAHTHGCDGSAVGDYFCSTPGSDDQTDGDTPTAAVFQTTITS